ncbi:MAG: hypothetical protein RR253_02445 [Oscillospiraceae bacterium]
MNTFTIYAIAAPLNAFICCAFITFFMKRLKLTPEIRMISTFVIYALIAFAISSGGQGLFHFDMSTFNLTLFTLYIASGICVCMGIYAFYKRSDISKKLAEKKALRKKDK